MEKDMTKNIRHMVSNLHPGQLVWTVDRDCMAIREHVFISSCPLAPGSADSAIILSAMPVGLHNYDELINYHLSQCEDGYETYLTVVYPEDIYLRQEDAEAALPAEDN